MTWTTYLGDVISSATLVLLVGFLLFTVSGVWPPLVAIESGSMDPNIKQGDLVFVMEETRFPGDGHVAGTGVVTAEVGADNGYSQFDGPGDVIVYAPDGNGDETPIIHRAMFWISEGENWSERADPAYANGAEDCEELPYCPAPYGGFITKGDANNQYDQVSSVSAPVRPEWIVGTAQLRIPALGHIRLQSSQAYDQRTVYVRAGTSDRSPRAPSAPGPRAAT